jgi:hypothetical protein
VKTSRLVADFCTDLSNGLKIWKRDADAVVASRRSHEDDDDSRDRLPPGTYVLPLSMKIPCSSKLPPSFESDHFRLRYTMSLALFAKAEPGSSHPRVLKLHSIPFHILPSTLPSPPPQLPRLVHDERRHHTSLLGSLGKAFSMSNDTDSELDSPSSSSSGNQWIVEPFLPTSDFTPGGVIPVSLRILPPGSGGERDVFVRLTLQRKTFVRSSSSPLEDNEWGLPEEDALDAHCRETQEVCSRWGWIEAAPAGGEVIIRDIALPLCGVEGEGWNWGYTTSLECVISSLLCFYLNKLNMVENSLIPSPPPTLAHGTCSWFSPALSSPLPCARSYDRHLHVSSRFDVVVEFAVVPRRPGTAPSFSAPPSGRFTAPRRRCRQVSGDGFPFSAGSSKLRELSFTVTVGSVAEPSLECLSPRHHQPQQQGQGGQHHHQRPCSSGENSSSSSDSDRRSSRVDGGEERGYGGDDGWVCPPPSYEDAVLDPPAI